MDAGNEGDEGILPWTPLSDTGLRAGSAEARLAAKDVAEGVEMSVGYGPDGATGQVSWVDGVLWKSDREIMQRTLLLGRPVVRGHDICDLMRRSKDSSQAEVRKKIRVGFPK